MNPCLHFACPEQYNTILPLNPILPSLLTTLPPFQNCHLIMFPPLPVPPPTFPAHYSLSPFPAHLPRNDNRYHQNSNVLSLGKQDKHVWLIVRQLDEIWMVICSPRAPQFSRSNPHTNTLRTKSLCGCELKAKRRTNLSRLKKYICAYVLILPGI